MEQESVSGPRLLEELWVALLLEDWLELKLWVVALLENWLEPKLWVAELLVAELVAEWVPKWGPHMDWLAIGGLQANSRGCCKLQ